MTTTTHAVLVGWLSDVHSEVPAAEGLHRNILPIAAGGAKERPDFRRRVGEKRIALFGAHQDFPAAFGAIGPFDPQDVRFDRRCTFFQLRHPIADVPKLPQQRQCFEEFVYV